MVVTKILSIKKDQTPCGFPPLAPRVGSIGEINRRKKMATSMVSSPNHPATCYWRAATPVRSQRCTTATTSAAAVVCKQAKSKSAAVTKRGLAIFLTTTTTTLGLGLGLSFQKSADAAILEADDDLELLEKVKKDRKKRLERQEVISSSNKEAAYVQELVYKLSKVGQAIDNNDLTAATNLLGSTTPISDSDWVKKGNAAFTKLTSNSEEKVEVDAFNSSLASLVSSVAQNDVNSSKIAFVSSATALEKWASMTGLASLLKGL